MRITPVNRTHRCPDCGAVLRANDAERREHRCRPRKRRFPQRHPRRAAR